MQQSASCASKCSQPFRTSRALGILPHFRFPVTESARGACSSRCPEQARRLGQCCSEREEDGRWAISERTVFLSGWLIGGGGGGSLFSRAVDPSGDVCDEQGADGGGEVELVLLGGVVDRVNVVAGEVADACPDCYP
jgi:hypothetical protein